MIAESAFVFAYVNPDTDGVGSSIGYAYWRSRIDGRVFEPVVFGEISKETSFVLEHFRISPPRRVSSLPQNAQLVLVDTHHINQLPHSVIFENVVEIVDHHPSGDVSSFPNAQIDNQLVGAAATIITERLQRDSIILESGIAGVLGLAIISNTLNFTAPSTSNRDKAALSWLMSIVNIDDYVIQKMFSAKSDMAGLSTHNILMSDYKEFSSGSIRIGIAQIESTSVEDLLTRNDLPEELEALRYERKVDYIFLNVVDVIKAHSIVLAGDEVTKKFLADTLQLRFDGNRAVADRILLRKTDFVPNLDWFASHKT